MFTGIIERVGIIRRVQIQSQGRKFTIVPLESLDDIRIGDSISTNGVCLTVIGFEGGGILVDVMAETLSRSTLGQLTVGDRVNMERALRLGERLGGHILLGHVDGVGVIKGIRRQGISHIFSVETGYEITRYVVPKGSIGIDGISLTIATIEEKGFTVSIIPHTLNHTTLNSKKIGDKVNLEADIIGKYVEGLLSKEDGLSIDFLAENGFL